MVIGVQSVDKVELLACILVGLKLRVHGSDSIVRVGGSERVVVGYLKQLSVLAYDLTDIAEVVVVVEIKASYCSSRWIRAGNTSKSIHVRLAVLKHKTAYVIC